MTDSDQDRVDARRVVSLLDLTELGDSATTDDVSSLCARAVGPHGRVAAVCLWPQFVTQAVQNLAGSGVRIATVTNFPSGAEPLATVVAQTSQALEDGADEIDVVLPYRQLLAGQTHAAEALLRAVRDAVPRDGSHRLKVILETGELVDDAIINTAARLAIGCGADFIKTSTGKSAVSATLAATAVMLTAISELDRRVGLKPSGGIRTLADAHGYLAQADEVMGPDWVTPMTFRFGASGLLGAVLAVLDGDDRSATATHKEGY